MTVLLRPASREARYEAQEAYEEAYAEASLDGCYSEGELLDFLMDKGLWSDRLQGEMAQLEHDIEEFKVKLVGLAFRSAEKRAGKLALARAKARHEEVFSLRHSHDHLTAHGVASMVKVRHLLASSLYYSDGRRLIGSLDEASPLFENACEAFLGSRLSDTALREVARTDPWRPVWAARKSCGSVFGAAAADLTDEQLRLAVWSGMYENVSAHPECPADEVLEDDDLLDGWFILQRRARAQRDVERRADDVVTNEKVRNSDEVYIVAQTPEDVARVEALNDEAARQAKRSRAEAIKARGAVQHVDLPDMRMWARMQAAQKKGK